ncbi:MAG: 2-oxoacid ferredoxin oxidoreductase [Elusimicrobia bacterium]|nr:2-oxoacid ferredoxin oxidoreductase [Elusimicrobiota bacterium]
MEPRAAKAAKKPDEFKSEIKPDWCPSCGDFGVLNALQKACATLGIPNKDVLCVSGIGCSSNLPGFFKTYGIHSLHGRSNPIAAGAKLANPELTVVITGGDGDGFGIGLGHFIHNMRRNLDVTYLVMDNQIYGLTTGQTSPTTTIGTQTKSTPEGCIEHPINPMALALVSGATFVARTFSGEIGHMTEVITKAISHKGFSFVDCYSPCVTYNKVNTYPWFKSRVYKLEDQKHDTADLRAALDKAFEEEKLPIGVFYKKEGVPSYEELDPTISRLGAPVKQPLDLKPADAKALKDSFR